MMHWSRRNVLQSGMAVPAAFAMGVPGTPASARSRQAQTAVDSAGLRERFLLDFGRRFHFGHAHDAAKDFGFGSGRSGGFQKTGDFLSPSNLAFDDGDWKPIDLPHDWVIGLSFQNDPSFGAGGGRGFPAPAPLILRRVTRRPVAFTCRT